MQVDCIVSISFWPRKAKKKSTNARNQEHPNWIGGAAMETLHVLKVGKDVTVEKVISEWFLRSAHGK